MPMPASWIGLPTGEQPAPNKNIKIAKSKLQLANEAGLVDTESWDAYVAFFTAAGNNEADAIRSKFDEAKAHADFALPGGLMESMADLLNRSHPAEEYDGFTPMLAAAKAGAYESVCGLHENGAVLFTRDRTAQNTPLHYAAMGGHTEMVKFMMSKGANKDGVNKAKRTPLMCAIFAGHAPAAMELLNAGADATLVDRNDISALHLASARGFTEIVTLIIDNMGEEPELERINSVAVPTAVAAPDTVSGLLVPPPEVPVAEEGAPPVEAEAPVPFEFASTPLHLAVVGGHVETAALLVEKGGEVNKETGAGHSCIFLACMVDSEELVNAFIAADGNVNQREFGAVADEAEDEAAEEEAAADEEEGDEGAPEKVITGNTAPLHVAAKLGNAGIITALCDAPDPANIEVRDQEANTPLLLAARGGNTAALQNLLEREAVVSAVADDGKSCLQLVVALGDEAAGCVAPLVEKEAAIEVKDKIDMMTPLLTAAKLGYSEVLAVLLEKEADVTAKEICGADALILATAGGHEACVDLLLERAVDVNATDSSSWTALHRALFEGHVAVADKLLGKGALVSLPDKHGNTAFHICAKEGHISCAPQIIQAATSEPIPAEGGNDMGLNRIEPKDLNEDTPLHIAAAEGEDEMISLLLEAGASVDCRNARGRVPLHAAAEKGYSTCLRILLDKKISDVKALEPVEGEDGEGGAPPPPPADPVAEEVIPDADGEGAEGAEGDGEIFSQSRWREEVVIAPTVDWEGTTPLHLAARDGHIDCVKMLVDGPFPVEIKIPIDAPDMCKRTALHLAAQNGHLEVVTALLEGRADPTAADIEGVTPLHLAIASGFVELTELLIASGADVKAMDVNGQDVLHWAASEGVLDAVDSLLVKGSSVKSVTGEASADKWTALHMAAASGQWECCAKLIEQGANVSVRSAHGMTPLHLACAAGHTAASVVLLQLGASPDDRDESGNTPVNYASGREEMANKERFYAAVDYARAVADLGSGGDEGKVNTALQSLTSRIDNDDTGGQLAEVLRTCGGLPLVADCLNHEAQGVQEAAMTLILSLLDCESNHSVLMGCGVLPPLVPLLAATNPAPVQEKAVDLLQVLMDGPSGDDVVAFMRGNLSLLISLLTSPCVPAAQTAAIMLADASAPAAECGSASATAGQVALGSDAIAPLHNLVAGSNPTLQASALRILGNISISDSALRKEIAACGVHKHLVVLLGSDSHEVCQSDARLIASLATVLSVKADLSSPVATSAIKPLVSLLQSEFADVKEQAARALATLTTNHRDNKQAIFFDTTGFKDLMAMVVSGNDSLTLESLYVVANLTTDGKVRKAVGSHKVLKLDSFQPSFKSFSPLPPRADGATPRPYTPINPVSSRGLILPSPRQAKSLSFALNSPRVLSDSTGMQPLSSDEILALMPVPDALTTLVPLLSSSNGKIVECARRAITNVRPSH